MDDIIIWIGNEVLYIVFICGFVFGRNSHKVLFERGNSLGIGEDHDPNVSTENYSKIYIKHSPIFKFLFQAQNFTS
jgi:hypothetical protein